jgi:hypothetical protein
LSQVADDIFFICKGAIRFVNSVQWFSRKRWKCEGKQTVIFWTQSDGNVLHWPSEIYTDWSWVDLYQEVVFFQASQELLHWNQTWHFVPTDVFNMCADWKFKMGVNWGQSLHRNLQEIQFSLALKHVPPFTVTKHLYKVPYTLCKCKCVHLNKVYVRIESLSNDIKLYVHSIGWAQWTYLNF